MDELPPLVKWAQDSPPLPDPYGWFDIRGEAADGFTADQMRAYAAAAVAMELEPQNVIRLALTHAAFCADESMTAGELRDAAVKLFGADSVAAAIRGA